MWKAHLLRDLPKTLHLKMIAHLWQFETNVVVRQIFIFIKNISVKSWDTALLNIKYSRSGVHKDFTIIFNHKNLDLQDQATDIDLETF